MTSLRLTRRAMLMASGATLALAAWRVPANADTPPGVLIVGQIAEPKALDPHAVTAANDFRICANLYDGLVRFTDGTLTPEPALAESWDISADGKTYTFKLRAGREVPRRVGFRRRGGEVHLRPDAGRRSTPTTTPARSRCRSSSPRSPRPRRPMPRPWCSP